jgi:hypothetical protein
MVVFNSSMIFHIELGGLLLLNTEATELNLGAICSSSLFCKRMFNLEHDRQKLNPLVYRANNHKGLQYCTHLVKEIPNS